MLMKIEESMESGGGDSSRESGATNEESPLPLSLRPKSNFSPRPENTSPLGPVPTSLGTHHMISSIAASSAAKNMTPGLLASLSALNAMSSAAAAASFHHHDLCGTNSSYGGSGGGGDRHSYGSPPAHMAPTNDPTANECKLVDYRGQKVAAFVISGETMLCLPQAFELFLKHLVGGLHTVYTKLKRLDIVPLVCNVEQVRILRGLGAIQPGVNRCKLLSCKDFDVLYKDCTTARPGRPPKRTSVPLVPLSGGHSTHSPYLGIKKHRLENGDLCMGYEPSHPPSDLVRLEKSPLLANGYNHPPTQLRPLHLLPMGNAAAAVAAHSLFSPSPLQGGGNSSGGNGRESRTNHQLQIPPMNLPSQWETARTAYEDFVKHFESRCYGEEDGSESDKSEDTNHISQRNQTPNQPTLFNGRIQGSSPVLNLSKNTIQSPSESEDNGQDVEEDEELSEQEQRTNNYTTDGMKEGGKSPLSGVEEESTTRAFVHLPHHLSSNEDLLRNIQALLKVAAENAKNQERRGNLEKAELKMELLRERELREQLEKDLGGERNLRVYYEKRWKKERRFRKKLEQSQEDEGESGSGESPLPPNPNYNPTLLNNNESQKKNETISNTNGTSPPTET